VIVRAKGGGLKRVRKAHSTVQTEAREERQEARGKKQEARCKR
jgi:Sec-independent protein translocase protein TatA